MKIKEVATLTKLPKETIRYYETLHLIKPERNQNGYREYSESDLNDLLFIIHLKKNQFFTRRHFTIIEAKKTGNFFILQRRNLKFSSSSYKID